MTGLRINHPQMMREQATLLLVLFALLIGWTIRQYLVIGWNQSESLSVHMVVAVKGHTPYRGDYVAFQWKGDEHYPAGSRFVKIVAGIPGDTVERRGRDFYVNGRFVGTAKPFDKAGRALEPSEPGILGKGEYYVMTPHPDSLDSRYKVAGWIKREEIIGRAYVLF